MGYSTEFKGELTFNQELTASQLSFINAFFGEDCRSHPEWINGNDLYYVDLELTADFSGIQWNGAEKTSDMPDIINMITLNTRTNWPDFSFTGKLLAQGEEIGDIWELLIDDSGMAYRKDVAMSGKVIKCPNCECDFVCND